MFKQEVPDLVVDVKEAALETPVYVIGTWRDVNIPGSPADIIAGGQVIDLTETDYDAGLIGVLPPSYTFAAAAPSRPLQDGRHSWMRPRSLVAGGAGGAMPLHLAAQRRPPLPRHRRRRRGLGQLHPDLGRRRREPAARALGQGRHRSPSAARPSSSPTRTTTATPAGSSWAAADTLLEADGGNQSRAEARRWPPRRPTAAYWRARSIWRRSSGAPAQGGLRGHWRPGTRPTAAELYSAAQTPSDQGRQRKHRRGGDPRDLPAAAKGQP